MRRPLFGTGFPKVLTDGTTPFTVFDTQAPGFDPQATYAVTLYTWQQLFTNVAQLIIDTGGVQKQIGVQKLTALGPTGGTVPQKIADRVLLRGNQKLIFNSEAGDAGNNPNWIFGYFERVGDTPEKKEYRPLQPSNNLVSPYSAPVVEAIAAAGGAADTQDVHLLDTQGRIDLVTLGFAAFMAEDPTGVGAANLLFPDGSVLPVTPTNSGVAHPLITQVPMLDGIPFQAPSGSSGLIQVVATTDVAAAEDLHAVVTGRFTRNG